MNEVDVDKGMSELEKEILDILYIFSISILDSCAHLVGTHDNEQTIFDTKSCYDMQIKFISLREEFLNIHVRVLRITGPTLTKLDR